MWRVKPGGRRGARQEKRGTKRHLKGKGNFGMRNKRGTGRSYEEMGERKGERGRVARKEEK